MLFVTIADQQIQSYMCLCMFELQSEKKNKLRLVSARHDARILHEGYCQTWIHKPHPACDLDPVMVICSLEV